MFWYAHAAIIAFVFYDVATQVDDRNIQQPLLHQIQDIKQATCSAITVKIGVDAFKLKMDDRHFYQRIYFMKF